MEKFIKSNLPKIIGVVVLIIVAVLIYFYSHKNSSTEKPIARSPQEMLLESKGLAEFNAENDTINDVSSQDKKFAEEMMPIIKGMGDLKDIAKNEETILALGKIIKKHPEYSDAYFLRATISVLVGDNNYQKILSDIDNAIKFHSSVKYKSAYDSTAEMYSLRAKVDIVSGNYQQATKDLETAIKTDPSETRNVFNTGGVKPEDDSNITALQKKDLDLLIAKYPADYRTYMFRGLFYASFTSYSEEYYMPALNDLKQAKKINSGSALVSYFLGSVYQKAAFYTMAAAADVSESGGYRDKTNSIALQHFNDAIKLDPGFADAYAQVAESLYSLKRYSEAIPYYDKVIELKSENAEAYNDRGLAKRYTNDYYGAIDDFSKAIELNKSKPNNIYLGQDNTYENRATAYMKVMNYDSAAEDYSKAIGLKFGSQVILMSVAQIRALYPEFKDVSEQDLLEGLRQKYFPNLSPAGFVGEYKHDITNNNGGGKAFNKEFVLGDLYASRGDAYLLAGNFRTAAKDYARAITEGSTSIMDRWKIISKTSDSEYSVDIQTLDFSQGNIVSLWVKILNTNTENYSQHNYQFDCSGRKIKSASATNYDSLGNVTHRSPAQDWQNIVPESIGEVLYNGMCK